MGVNRDRPARTTARTYRLRIVATGRLPDLGYDDLSAVATELELLLRLLLEKNGSEE
jgi:hypothetical protein